MTYTREERLAQACHRIAESERRVDRQTQLVEQLALRGRDTRDVLKILGLLYDMLILAREDLERLQEQSCE